MYKRVNLNYSLQIEHQSCTTLRWAWIIPNAECTDCQEQPLFCSKEGKGIGEASGARPAWVGNKDRVQLVTALSADVFPGLSQVSFPKSKPSHTAMDRVAEPRFHFLFTSASFCGPAQILGHKYLGGSLIKSISQGLCLLLSLSGPSHWWWAPSSEGNGSPCHIYSIPWIPFKICLLIPR